MLALLLVLALNQDSTDAYDSRATRDLVALARSARHADDARLQGYDATVLQQMSIGIQFARFVRQRTLFRKQTAARVRWQRGAGAVVDVTGDRTAVPIVPEANAGIDDGEGLIALPYVPGRPIPWQRSTHDTIDANDWIDPLAPGAEAYYRYTAGDSETIRAPGAEPVHVREVRLHPRRPEWNLGVGSLWFDANSGHLVRAVYRFAAPMNIAAVAKSKDPHSFDDVPIWVRPLIFPMSANVSTVIIEYGLLENRFWLPTGGLFEGEARAGGMRFPFDMEARYRYTSVNIPDSLPPIAAAVLPDSEREHARQNQCVHDSVWTAVDTAGTRGVPVLTRTPCDTAKLARSPSLPPDLYADQGVGPAKADVSELLRAIGMNAQPDWAPQLLRLHYGLDHGLVRYNRVEGLSAGFGVSEELGRGYSWYSEARFGVADRQPNAELRVAQSDDRSSLGLGLYRRLDSANDWGDPLSLGSSLSALLFGDDEGFYYRSWGGEFTGQGNLGFPYAWRLFAEGEGTAQVNTNFSFTHAFDGPHAPANLVAREGAVTGFAVRVMPSLGIDPYGLRLTSNLRAEGGAGTFDYLRGAADLTISNGIAHIADGAITLSAGITAGQPPPQRWWYLGGLSTVRGLPPGVDAGDTYWLTRFEIGPRSVAFKPVLFYDMGWAGDRGDWGHEGRPLSGAGLGLSFLDGLIRLDVAHAIYPGRSWRVNSYLNATF
ncbi:MAG TPA: hypothetical protein VFA43_13275 [Gemmatimonadaceae bacterium]|nr:hypothetical protein [Gemmatimonadaceae bacterium]